MDSESWPGDDIRRGDPSECVGGGDGVLLADGVLSGSGSGERPGEVVPGVAFFDRRRFGAGSADDELADAPLWGCGLGLYGWTNGFNVATFFSLAGGGSDKARGLACCPTQRYIGAIPACNGQREPRSLRAQTRVNIQNHSDKSSSKIRETIGMN